MVGLKALKPFSPWATEIGWAVIRQKCMRVLLKKTQISMCFFAGGVFVVLGSYGNALRIEVSTKNSGRMGGVVFIWANL